jgi:hypothetical protein
MCGSIPVNRPAVLRRGHLLHALGDAFLRARVCVFRWNQPFLYSQKSAGVASILLSRGLILVVLEVTLIKFFLDLSP